MNSPGRCRSHEVRVRSMSTPFVKQGGKVVTLGVVVAVVSLAEPSYAYVDPNVGGVLYQIFFPVLMALLAVWVFLRNRLLALIKRILKSKDDRSETK